MEINGTKIGQRFSPYIIAEISCNHGGKVENAIELIKQAKKAGASAVKTQCYEPQTITLNVNKPDFILQDGLWKGRTLWELYKTAQTPFSWQKHLYQYAQDIGITIFSSVFDKTAVDHLEKLNCPAYKIASMEIVDIPLIEYAASTGKPMIISTGMASQEEIFDAYQAAPKAAFLHCTSEYPGTIETSNLGAMRQLQKMLPSTEIGISDHSEGSLIPVAATALGANIIEKHFGQLKGVKSEDDAFSMSVKEFAQMVVDVKKVYSAMQPHPTNGNPTRQVRRSLYAIEDIRKGEIFTENNIGSIRPGYGLPPKKLPQILGQRAPQDYRRGDPLK